MVNIVKWCYIGISKLATVKIVKGMRLGSPTPLNPAVVNAQATIKSKASDLSSDDMVLYVVFTLTQSGTGIDSALLQNTQESMIQFLEM